jgi:hypothetical protein
VDVGVVAGEKRKEQKRSYLCESDVAENDGRPGLQVQVPTDGDGKHLKSEARQKAPGEQETKVAISK